MDSAYKVFMSFISSMLGFAQHCYEFFLGGMRLANSTVTNVINRVEAFMPGPNVLNFINDVFTSFGTVLFIVLIVRVIMTMVNLINPLS